MFVATQSQLIKGFSDILRSDDLIQLCAKVRDFALNNPAEVYKNSSKTVSGNIGERVQPHLITCVRERSAQSNGRTEDVD